MVKNTLLNNKFILFSCIALLLAGALFAIINKALFQYNNTIGSHQVVINNKNDAIQFLKKKLRGFKKTDSWLTGNCVTYRAERRSNEWIVELHERHNEDCWGDPNTMPLIAQFKINKKSYEIVCYDIMNDKYIPLEQYLLEGDQATYLIQQDKIMLNFGKKIILTQKQYPQLFDSFPPSNPTQFYTTTLHNYESGQMVQIDRMIYAVASYTPAGSLLYDLISGKYLVSPQEQTIARYPETNIISTSPLVVRFYYDVSRPSFCHGVECRGYWMEYYEWDGVKKEFINVNTKYKDEYRKLLKEHEQFNIKGCEFDNRDIEGTGVKTLEEVFKSSKTNYCYGSTRDELNRFMEYKAMIEKLIN